ncbi:MAG: hypothetical protein AAGH90_09685 [Pseudomonadota bacterium]
MGNPEMRAQTALNRFLQTVKDAAAEDPGLSTRLIEALGVTVLYEGDEQFEGANPVSQAKRWSPEAFKRIWGTAKVGQIKAALKDHELATATDMKGKKKAALIDLLYKRAEARSRETGMID